LNETQQYSKYDETLSYKPGDVVIRWGGPHIMDGSGCWSYGETLPKLNIAMIEEILVWTKATNRISVTKFITKSADLGMFKGLKWNQNTWGHSLRDEQTHEPCGTACCIAGAAAILAGIADKPVKGYMQINPQTITGYNGETVKVSEQSWYDAGAAILGLTRDESIQLFNGDNNLTQVKRLVRSFAKARGEYIQV